jgi:cysteinyl-tRNA synthetase
MHGWSATLDFKESSMRAAADLEQTINNFFRNVTTLIRDSRLADERRPLGTKDFGEIEKDLLEAYVCLFQTIRRILVFCAADP